MPNAIVNGTLSAKRIGMAIVVGPNSQNARISRSLSTLSRLVSLLGALTPTQGLVVVGDVNEGRSHVPSRQRSQNRFVHRTGDVALR
jgi:hypothetical protein